MGPCNPTAWPIHVTHGRRSDATELPNVTVGWYHPEVDGSYDAGTAVSANHPSIQARVVSLLPDNHLDVDSFLANPSAHPLPSWHPRLSEMVSRRPAVEFTVGTSVLLTLG